MTMIPAHHQNREHCYGYGGCGGYGGGVCCCGGGNNYSERSELIGRVRLQGYDCCGLGSDLVVFGPMDESRTESVNEAGSSSKDVVNQDENKDEAGWLQLGIGGGHNNNNDSNKHLPGEETAARGGGLIELDLLPPGGNSSQHLRQQVTRQQLAPPIFHVPEFRAPNSLSRPVTNNMTASLFLQYPGMNLPFPPPPAPPSSHHLHQNPDINWAFRPAMARHIAAASSSSSSSSSLMRQGSYFSSRPFQLHAAGVDVAGPSFDLRVVDPPPRPHSGIWFVLQASENQTKEPFLAQIPKNYLRIKDGRMTVRLLMKYLANKLRLESESEIEIRCRGQQLLPFLTLQHVRDNIWSRRDAVTLLPDSSTTDHVMVLHYARSAS